MQETVVENPYGLGALLANGNIVSRSILAVLLIMSLMTWFIMITKFFDQRKQRKQALRDFQNVRFEGLTKPLPDLLANRAAMVRWSARWCGHLSHP